MRFPFSFTRYVTVIPSGGKVLGSDAVPTGGPTMGGIDNLLDFPSYDVHGNPISMLAIATSIPSTATMDVQGYAFEEQCGVWLAIGNFKKTAIAAPGKIDVVPWITSSQVPLGGNPRSTSVYVRLTTSDGAPVSGKYVVAFSPCTALGAATF